MRARDLATFVALTVLICVLFSTANVTAGQKIVGLDARVHALDFSKAVPGQLNYQGFLVNATDSSAVTATLEMTFRLFDSEAKGAELWSEIHPAVEVSNGLFHVFLGELEPFPESLFSGATLWLQTEVGTEVLSPRKPLVSVAYGMRAQEADHATMAEWATTAQHADHADTADVCPGISAWIVDGDDIYRTAGRVGIGTDSPSYTLDVDGTVGATTYYGDGSNLTGISGTTDDDWTISGDTIYHQVGPVGIGTTSPEAKLHIDDDTGIHALYVKSADTTAIVGITEDSTNYSYGGYFEGHSHHGGGIYSISAAGTGVYGLHTDSGPTSPGVYGQNLGSGAGVLGRANQYQGVYGISSMGEGVYAYNTATDIYSYLADTVWAGFFSGDAHISGNVGIGTTSPTAPLTIQAISGPDLQFTTSGNNADIISNSEFKIGTSGSQNLHLLTNNTYRVTVTSGGGHLGIGTASPHEKLHIHDDTKGICYTQFTNTSTGDGSTDGLIVGINIDGNAFIYNRETLANLNLGTANNTRLHIDNTGEVGIGTTTPTSLLEVQNHSDSPDMRIDAAVGGAAYLRFSQDNDQKATIKMTSGGDLQLDTEASGAAGITVLNSNANVGIGTESPARVLHVNDVIRLEPRATAPSSPSMGDMYVRSTDGKLMVYDGTTWQACW